MPMRYERYPPDWDDTSLRIRKAAGDRCEMCGVANGALVERAAGKLTKIVLTVHHIGVPYPGEEVGDPHDKMDCRPVNLIALCQQHHLAADDEIRRLTRKWEEKGWKEVHEHLGGVMPWGVQYRYDRGTIYGELRVLAAMRERVGSAEHHHRTDGAAGDESLRDPG